MFINLVNVAKRFYNKMCSKKHLFIKCNSNTVILIYIIYFFFIREGFFEYLVYKRFLKSFHFLIKQIYVLYYFRIRWYYFEVLQTSIIDSLDVVFMCLSTSLQSTTYSSFDS